MGPEHTIVVSRRLRVRVPSEVLFFSFFFFFFHPCIKNATYSFLSGSGTFKKTSIQYQKKKSNKGLGSTSLFLLYSIAGHNNTAIKITNTYSDDQLVIYIFKRQTQQKQ